MRKRLAVWDRDFATPEERKVAAEINRKVGYEVPQKSVHGETLNVNYV
jgi:alkane 1-monooxygenase